MKVLNNAIKLYLEGIEDGNYEYAIDTYATPDYKQHSTGVKTGADGFKAFFKDFITRYPERHFKLIHGFEQENFAFMFVLQNLNGKDSWFTMDIFKANDEGKIIEHWDIIEAYESDEQYAGRMRVTENSYALTEIVQDNLNNLKNFIGNLSKRTNKFNYDNVELHRIIRFENFVATLIKFSDKEEYAAMQLFEFADEKLIGYWDVVEQIVPLEIAKNSGKF